MVGFIMAVNDKRRIENISGSGKSEEGFGDS